MTISLSSIVSGRESSPVESDDSRKNGVQAEQGSEGSVEDPYGEHDGESEVEDYGDEESEEDSGDDDEEAAEESSDEVEDDVESEDDSADGDEEETEHKADSKDTVLMRVDGKDVPVKLKAKIPTKIDGKIELPTISELQKAWVNKVSYAEHSGRWGEEKRRLMDTVERQSEELKSVTIGRGLKESLSEFIKEGDLAAIVTHIVDEFPDVDPVDFWRRAEEPMKQYWKEYFALSPAEQAKVDVERDRQELERRRKKDGERQEQQQSKQEESRIAESIAQSAGISVQDLTSGWNAIMRRIQEGKMSKENVERLKKMSYKERVELAAGQHFNDKARNVVKNVLSQVDQGLAKDDGLVEEIFSELGSREILSQSPKKLKELISSAHGSSSKPKLRLGRKAMPRHRTDSSEDSSTDRAPRVKKPWGYQGKGF